MDAEFRKANARQKCPFCCTSGQSTGNCPTCATMITHLTSERLIRSSGKYILQRMTNSKDVNKMAKENIDLFAADIWQLLKRFQDRIDVTVKDDKDERFKNGLDQLLEKTSARYSTGKTVADNNWESRIEILFPSYFDALKTAALLQWPRLKIRL